MAKTWSILHLIIYINISICTLIIIMEQSRYLVSEEAVKEFRKKGFIKLREVIKGEELENFRKKMNEAVDKVTHVGDKQKRIDDYSSIFTQVTNLWQVEPATQSFVLSKYFADIARQLLGVQHMRLYHDQALVKPPKAGKTPWHQDHFYWPIDSLNAVTMWMPMHDCPREMGTMKFVVGSHTSQTLQEFPISEQSQEYFEKQISEQKLAVETYDLLQGDATFHYGRTLHCAHSNGNTAKRQVMTIIYFQDGARAMEQGKMNEFRKVDLSVFCPGTLNGQVIRSQLNPLLV